MLDAPPAYPPRAIEPSSNAYRLPSPAPPAYPPLAEQAASLARAAVRFAASGFKLADQAERERRREICRACPSGLYDDEKDRCRACGCLASVKPWLGSESCPKGHW